MPFWTTVFVTAASAGLAIYHLFRDDPRPTGTTAPPPTPHSRTQATPESPDYGRDPYHSSRNTFAGDSRRTSSAHLQPSARAAQAKTQANLGTPDYDPYRYSPSPYVRESYEAPSARTYSSHGYDLHRSGLAPSYVKAKESRQTPSTPTHAQPSYQPPTYARVAQAAAKTKANLETPDYGRYQYRSLASPYAQEAREAGTTSAYTHTSYSNTSTPTRVGQTTVNNRTTADDYDYCHHHFGLASPYSQETPLFNPASSPTRTSYLYQRAPSPDAARPLKHTHTRSTSSTSDSLGPSSPIRVVSRSPSLDPDSQYGLEFDVAENVEDKEAGRKLREQARRSNREMREARDLAKSARKRGDHRAENTYRQDAIAHESKMKNLDKRAAKIIFRENNKRHREGTVDLHGLYVPEAIEYVKKELQFATFRNDDRICFIVGKGLHSHHGVSKLRPALEEVFDERQLTYSEDLGNAGMLIVELD